LKGAPVRRWLEEPYAGRPHVLGDKMMNKNEKEKKMLYEWGIRNHSFDCFLAQDKTVDSYFIDRENKQSSYIKGYGFETLPEFLKELDALWGDNEMMTEIRKIVGIAAIKNKPSRTMQKKSEGGKRQNDTEDKLPTFIYNF